MAFLRAGPDEVTYVAPDGTIVMMTDAALRNLDCELPDVIGLSIFEAFPASADTLRAQIRSVVTTKSACAFRSEIPSPDDTRALETVASPILDEGGECIAIHIVSKDVTEVLRTKNALRDTSRTHRLALDAVKDGVWDWTLPTGELAFSPNFFRLLGYAENEIFEGQLEWFYSVVHPEDRPVIRHRLSAHLKNEDSEYVSQFRWKHKDGRWRWALARGRVVERTADGEPLRMVGTTVDITDRHALEARLLAAQKMEAIGRLAGGVAHDFNNLLTTVVGHVSFLRSYGLGAEATHDLDRIAEAVARGARLTDQLLSFARRRMVQPRAVGLNPILNHMRMWLDDLLGPRIRLHLTLADDLPDVFIDPSQLEQVFMNLVLNARDAMPDGGDLHVSTRNVAPVPRSTERPDRVGSIVRLTVSDTGHGMPPEVMQRIFEPFYTTKATGEGTGLGLASCYGIVKQAGGHIEVSSELGKGTSLIVDLPASS